MRTDPPTPDQRKFIESFGLECLKTFTDCNALVEFIREGNNDETVGLTPHQRANLYRQEREKLLGKLVKYRNRIWKVSFVGPRLKARCLEPNEKVKIPTFYARLIGERRDYATIQPSTKDLQIAA